MNLRQKSFEIFNGLFDFGAGAIRNGFYPVQIGGMASPPINIVRTTSGEDLTPKRVLNISAAWACIWLIADTISTLPFVLNKRSGSNTWGAPAVDNPVYTVVGQSPNALMTAPEFWQYMIASEQLWGAGYAKKDFNVNGDCISLETLLPQFMVPYKVPQTGELRYKYMPEGLYNSPIQDFSAEQIFHLKDHTLDGITGLSRVEYARNSMGIALAADQASADAFRNGLRSTGFLMYDRVMKEEQRRQIRENLEKFKTGGKDAAGFMVLEAGMTFQSLSMNPADAQLLTSRQFAVEDVCRWFGVPPVLIGHAAAGVTAWGSGIEQLLLGFQSLTLRPIIRRIEAAVQRSLVRPQDRSQYYLTIDTDDLLGADSTARAALYSTYAQNGIRTRNEIRAAEDLAPMDGGDSLTVQSNLVPLDKLEQMGGQPTPPPVPPAVPPPKPPPEKRVLS